MDTSRPNIAGLAVSQADLRDPAALLDDPVLHGVIARPLAAGSWLAISVAHFTDEELMARLYALHTTAPFQNHGTGQLAAFLAGLDLIPPGIAEVRRWLSGIAGTPKCRPAYLVCGVGAKP